MERGDYVDNSTVNINCSDTTSKLYYSIITALACFLNIFLFFLVRNNTHNMHMKPYLKILYSSLFIDLSSAIFQFLIQARPSILGKWLLLTMSFDGCLPFLLDKVGLLQGGNIGYLLIIEFWGCYSVVIYASVPFIFRYFVAVRNYKMSTAVYLSILFVALGIALFASIIVSYLAVRNYEENILLVPKHDSNCLRFIPQVNMQFNLKDKVLIYLKFNINLTYFRRLFTYFGHGTI